MRSLANREMAFLQFGEQTMIRHLQFSSSTLLKKYLIGKTPAHMYYSSAYYDSPQNPLMNDKGWNGADLVFDIDVDHIPTECKNDHDKWACLECGSRGAGFPPETCPGCKGKKIETAIWVCERCLDVAKEEAFKLLDGFLIPDFGVSVRDVEICFSGHRGYHLHIMTESLRRLASDGRREVADYVRGLGLNIEAHGFIQPSNSGLLLGPTMTDRGWRGRLAKSIYEFVSRCTMEDLKKAVAPAVAEALFKNKETFLRNLASTPPYWGGIKGYTIESLRSVAKAATRGSICNIDERVTLDIKRLMRHPNSLHGKTGLKTARISYSDLEKFDPLRDAVAFRGGELKIYVREIPRVRIGNCEVGPLKGKEGKELEVGKALGIYLICKGAAEPRL